MKKVIRVALNFATFQDKDVMPVRNRAIVVWPGHKILYDT